MKRLKRWLLRYFLGDDSEHEVCPLCGGKVIGYAFNLADDGYNLHKKIYLAVCDEKPYTCKWKDWGWR